MSTVTVTIAIDDPTAPDVLDLLGEHLSDMYATSPAESVHALDPSALAAPGITFWTARDGTGVLLGCAALKELGPADGELKSMRTTAASRGQGVGAAMLAHVLGAAAARGIGTVHLETGTEGYFAPARRLYERAGFVESPPFADYVLDPHSVFYRLTLSAPTVPATGPRAAQPAS
ncbi:GNAT family N-acetyltransferase [Cellulomonas sp. Leaf334]|uniref:GNAT family N-acetyltransferase n=1 Tax=Cellulomonas sp. Leaf334 TaxID=1736339 RepID=UPI0006F67B9A|nr:GNAT family N-acetyltransferase [Cellulomonas sp. Leaf334]KQR15953.1 GCN5 family acetyltransferase [Cellulomonas sp. Leaf334]